MPLLLTLLVLANAAWVAYFGLHVHGLALYDEKFAVQGARWLHGDFWGRLFELPSFGDRGVERLTALLLTPAVAIFASTAHQFVVNHLVLAFVFSLQAVPAFLLARGLRAGIGWSFFAAALSVFGPWAVFGTVFLNNAPAACAASFALWAMWRALLDPGPARDALAIALVALAALSRVSSAVLVVVFPVAIVVHALITRRRSELKRHWLLGLVAVLAVVWLATGHLHSAVGAYPTSVHASAGMIGRRLLTTVAHLAAGAGFVAVAVGAAWVVRQVVRPLSPEANAFALLALGWFAVLAYVNLASGIDERYELMLFVPLAVAFTTALARREITLVPALVAAAVVWIALRRHGDIAAAQASDYLTWPSREFLGTLWLNKAHTLGLGRGLTLHLIGVAVVAVVLALALVRGRRERGVVAAVAVFVLAYALVGSGWAMQKVDAAQRAHASFSDLTFIDGITGGERTDPLGSTAETDSAIPTQWSEVQYFNRAIAHPVSLEGKVYDLCCGPEGRDQVLAVDHATGALTSSDALPRYVATVPEWLPAGLATRLVATSEAYAPPVRLERLQQPPRAAWLSTGFDSFGWVRPRAQARLRVFPAGSPGQPACLRTTMIAPTTVPRGQVHWHVGHTTGVMTPGARPWVDIPLHGSAPIDLDVGAAPAGPDPLTGAPGELGLADMRLVRCGEHAGS